MLWAGVPQYLAPLHAEGDGLFVIFPGILLVIVGPSQSIFVVQTSMVMRETVFNLAFVKSLRIRTFILY